MEYKINQYDAIQSGRYNGKFQLKLGFFNKSGEFKTKFSTKQIDGVEKHFPVSMTFDTDQEAEGILLTILKELTGKDYAVKEGDIPF